MQQEHHRLLSVVIPTCHRDDLLEKCQQTRFILNGIGAADAERRNGPIVV